MSVVSATSFHSLRQLQRVHRSLDTESAATLVHAFVTSRLDYCNILLAGSPKTHRQAAASHERCSANRERHTGVRPGSDTAPSRWAALARCGRSGHVQARLDGIQVSSRPGARLLVWAVHAGRSSPWTTASPFSRPRLARRPRFQLNTYGRRAFAVAAPATWNTLSDELRNPDLHNATFRRNLKTFLFQQYLVHWAH